CARARESREEIGADGESGLLYVSDAGDRNGKGGAVYRINPKGKVDVVTNAERWPGLHTPAGLVLDGQSHLLLVDAGTGTLHRIKFADGKTEKLADGLGSGDGLTWDKFGRLYISDGKGGQLFVIPRPGDKPTVVASGLQSPADISTDATGKNILVPNRTAGTVTANPAQVPGAPVDETPLPVE